MKRPYRAQSALFLFLALMLMLSVSVFAQIVAVPNSLHFQGRLARPDGTPVPDGTYSLRFSLHTALSGGSEVWNQPLVGVAIRNGTFAALLSGFPGGAFNGNLFLEIKIGTDAPLTPRQALVTVPYAFKADMALTVPDQSITNAKIATGTITADKFASDIFNPIAWLLGGNSGTNPTSHFLGTTDNQPLNFRVNNERALRLERVQYGNLLGVNVLAGWEGNSITEGVTTATIAGGGEIVTNLNQPVPNRVTDIGGTVGGGAGNIAGSADATLNNATFTTVSGGLNNTANGTLATVGGGQDNTAGGAATVSGGFNNTASGAYATVGGGRENTAIGESSIVSGGSNNTAAGFISFAAGRRAKANHDGAFVWADNTNTDFASTNVNQFLIRAGGGVGINKNDPAAALDIAGSAYMTGFRLSTLPSLGSVLLSDAEGDGSWGQVGSAGLADNAVTSAKIQDSTVAAADLASNAVTTTKILDSAVTSTKIANSAVTNAKIQSVDWNKLTNVPTFNYWGLSGNSGVTNGFLGTADDNPLEFRANNRRAMRYDLIETAFNRTVNVLGGSEVNFLGADVEGATIAGGGLDSIASTDGPNRVTQNYGTVSGGYANLASGTGGTVGGGSSNTASGNSATIGGGAGNSASGISATIGGGSGNSASGAYATVPGGNANAASGDYALAAGRSARANHDGAFVWADSQSGTFTSSAVNQFLIRAQNGVGINASSLRGDFDLRSASGNANFYMQAGGAASGVNFGVSSAGSLFIAHYDGTTYTDRLYLNPTGNVGIGTTNPGYKLHVNGSVAGVGNYNNVSDVRYKTNVQTIPDALDTILNLRGVTFDWKHADYPGMSFSEGRQIGFIAQEVEKVLPELVSTDHKGYKSVAYANVVPVLVEAVKTLRKENDAVRREYIRRETRIAELEARFNALVETVAELQANRK